MILCILHISDLHFRALEKDPVRSFNADVVTKSMLKAIDGLIKDNIIFDLVIVTGDLVFSGKKEEYHVAERFFSLLREITGLPNSKFFVVPGNHDVDRTEISDWQMKSIYSINTQDDITKIISDKDLFPILMRKFSCFNAFANIVSGRILFDEKHYFHVKSPHIHKQGKIFSLNLLGLNSALFAGYDGDDKQKLALGLYQVNNALQQTDKNALISIAFFHHPFSSFYPGEKVVLNMLTRNMDIVLHGHLNDPANAVRKDSSGKVVVIGAGTGFKKRTSANSFNIITINPETGNGRILFFKYLHEHNCWIKNHEVNPHNKDGEFQFTIDLAKKAGKITAIPAEKKELSEDITHYIDWVREEYGFIDIRGVIAGSEYASRFRIDELYIPLATTAKREFQKETGKNEPGKQKERRILLSSVLNEQYVTIIGDPGSGKTTFLQYVISVLARAYAEDDPLAAREKLGLDGFLFPVFIRISELSDFILNTRAAGKDCPASDTDPAWIIHFLDDKNRSLNWEFSRLFFTEKLKNGGCILLLDGLDETPDEKMRRQVSKLIINAIRVNKKCRFIITTRPQAYVGLVQLINFTEYIILPLDYEGIYYFLNIWSQTLFSQQLVATTAEKHLEKLITAVQSSYAIRRLALNPLMLTALAVIHWNQKRLPEQRAELYESIIRWMLRSREHVPGRLPPEVIELFYQKCAYAMQSDPAGRQVMMGRKSICEILAGLIDIPNREQRYARAEALLTKEEMESGIIVLRGQNITFRHLTFQEYLCAKALGGKTDSEQQKLLLDDVVFESPEWKEVLLLYCGILYKQGMDKINGFFHALLTWQKTKKELKTKARLFGLIGAMERDLSPYQYKINDPFFTTLKNDVMAIFDRDKARTIQVKIRCDAADALGQAGDPRLLEDNFITIPACTFLMGAQKDDPDAPNYDPAAYPDESPVHEVRLSAYKIGKYPVTVGEYARFIEADGYKNKDYWKAGGFGEFHEPENWETQVQFPTRPVVYVSWFEAKAYMTWLGEEYDLPTEAQWERAAKGPGKIYRKYPWGNNDPDKETANWDETKLEHPTPVGIFPLDQTVEGVYDMGGNVEEWCLDWKDVGYETKSTFYKKSIGSSDPLNDTTGEWGKTGNTGRRVLRGGSWFNPYYLRCCLRNYFVPAIQDDNVGFRVVRLVR